jgi:hypothetical protein
VFIRDATEAIGLAAEAWGPGTAVAPIITALK